METLLAQQKKIQNFGPKWLQDMRAQAFKQTEALGLPTAKQEAWKYTSLKEMIKIPFELGISYAEQNIDKNALPCMNFKDSKGVQIIFVNGHFAPKLSNLEKLPKGLTISSLSEVWEQDGEKLKPYLGKQTPTQEESFAALNTAFLQDGAWIHLAKGCVIESPIEIFYFSLTNGAPSISHPRTLIVAEENSQMTLVENYAGKLAANPYFTNAVTEIFAGPSAIIDHYKIQDECEQSFHLSSISLKQLTNSTISSTNISIGAKLSRTDIRAALQASGAHCDLNGLYMAHGQQHMDHQTRIDHTKPHCTSQELYKGILDGASHGVFNGQILVKKDAQKTNSNLRNNNLLLSDQAQIDTKPLLEIFADDVKCAHGATIGRLDEKQIFYLRSRGISKKFARNLLTYAFASEVLGQLKIESLKSHLEEILLNRLQIHELSVGGIV